MSGYVIRKQTTDSLSIALGGQDGPETPNRVNTMQNAKTDRTGESARSVWDELNAWEPGWVSCEPTYSGEVGARGVIVRWHVRVFLRGNDTLQGEGNTLPEAIAAAVKAGERA